MKRVAMMITILRFILFFLLAPALAVIAQAAGAVQDDFRIVDVGIFSESVILDTLDGDICNYDSSGAQLQQRRSLNGKAADDDDLSRFCELDPSGAERPLFSVLAELVATKKAPSAFARSQQGSRTENGSCRYVYNFQFSAAIPIKAFWKRVLIS